jgi:hypothetical protein
MSAQGMYGADVNRLFIGTRGKSTPVRRRSWLQRVQRQLRRQLRNDARTVTVPIAQWCGWNRTICLVLPASMNSGLCNDVNRFVLQSGFFYVPKYRTQIGGVQRQYL